MKSSLAVAVVVSGLVVSGFAALAVHASDASPNSPQVATTDAAAASGETPSNIQGAPPVPAYPEGAAEYDAATQSIPLPLPDGYEYPADPEITGPWADTLAWDHWLAATADAALRAQNDGNVEAVTHYQDALRSAWNLHLSAQMANNASFVLDAFNEGNFPLILQMFPVPAGMARP